MGKGAQRSPAHMGEAEEKTTADVLIGGYLYEVGCWPAPFEVTAMILALLQPLMLLLLGRHAPEKMKPKKKISPRKLLTIADLWIVLVPCVCVNLVPRDRVLEVGREHLVVLALRNWYVAADRLPLRAPIDGGAATTPRAAQCRLVQAHKSGCDE